MLIVTVGIGLYLGASLVNSLIGPKESGGGSSLADAHQILSDAKEGRGQVINMQAVVTDDELEDLRACTTCEPILRRGRQRFSVMEDLENKLEKKDG